jgi:signal transduction histidine kinase
LHIGHWVILVLSLGVTTAAWWFSDQQITRQTDGRFQQETDRVRSLIVERMETYEDALIAGIGTIDALGGQVSAAEWARFAGSLRLERRYPGIHGIGVIEQVRDVEAYVAQQRLDRPDFHIFPAHDRGEWLPITYVEPVADNFRAVGLDMAHEDNRYNAAVRARATGTTQITGPIALVQEDTPTPGFLIFAPRYERPTSNDAERRHSFKQFVYAPFVVHRLMEGVLARETRLVDLRVTDADEVTFDEIEFDQARRRSSEVLPLYGRTWRLDYQATPGFARATASSQPLLILIAGLTVDLVLLFLFLTIARARERAELAAVQLQEKHAQAVASNEDLERFAYVASHDLREPLRMVTSYLGVLGDRLDGRLDPIEQTSLGFALEGGTRMQQLLDALLAYGRAGRDVDVEAVVDLDAVMAEVADTLKPLCAKTGGSLDVSALGEVTGNRVLLTQLLQNLVSNGLKYHREDVAPRIEVAAVPDGLHVVLSVRDNGLGIETEHLERIFEPFKRLHRHADLEGSGVGLAICARVAERHHTRIEVRSDPGRGTTFSVRLKRPHSTPEHA